MGLISKIFGGIKKVIRKIGGGIKRLVKKIGGAFGKLGILGHIGMMFLMPYLPGWWGTMGEWATRLTQGTGMAGKAFGHVMRGVYHAGKAVGTVYRGVTEAISGSLKWLGNKAGAMFGKPELFGAKPFAGLEDWKNSVSDWGKEGWTGKLPVDTPISDQLAASLKKPPTMEQMTEGFEYKPKELPEYMKQQGFTPLEQYDDFRKLVGGMDPNIDIMTGEAITKPDWMKGSVTKDITNIGTDKVAGGQNLLDRAKDFGSDFVANVKEDLSAQGLADAATEGVTGGLKQAVGQKVMEAAGYEQPDYISKQVVVPTIQTFQGEILDNNQMNTFASNGYNYGSHQMNQYYSQVFQDHDAYLLWLNQALPPENITRYQAQPAGGGY
jgi:hypothetical protein